MLFLLWTAVDCSPAVSCVLVDELRLWKRSVSFGGVSSSAELPFYFSHASVDADTRAKHRGVAEAVSPGLVRLSVGIEHPQDLIDDLAQAISAATQPPRDLTREGGENRR